MSGFGFRRCAENPHFFAHRLAREPFGRALHTLLVDDLDGFIADLAARGITAASVETIGPGVRRTTLTDPDGHCLNIG